MFREKGSRSWQKHHAKDKKVYPQDKTPKF
jgi:hypothetical protein